jgi:hypothetical protein
MWSVLAVREDTDKPFSPDQSIHRSTSLNLWEGNSLTLEIDQGAAALFADKGDCDPTFDACLLRGSASTCVDGGKLGYRRKGKNSADEVNVSLPLMSLANAAGDGDTEDSGPFRLKVTASGCGGQERREIRVRRRSVRARRYDSLDTFIMFEHAQSSKLRPGFATSVTWGWEFSPECKGVRCWLTKVSNFLDLGFGLHVALLTFTPDQNPSRVEFGVGLSGTAFGGLLVFGYGSNLTTDFVAQRYFFVGTSVSTIVEKARGVLKPSK